MLLAAGCSLIIPSSRTPHGASRLVQAMSAWLVTVRRAPSRHSRDARVYGHTTTAMHELSTPPHTSACLGCISSYLAEGPPGVLPAQRYKSVFLRHSRKTHELQLLISAIPFTALDRLSSRPTSSFTSYRCLGGGGGGVNHYQVSCMAVLCKII